MATDESAAQVATLEASVSDEPENGSQNPISRWRSAQLERRLKSIGKLGAYEIVRDKGYLLAPFEMRQMLDPEAIRTATELRLTRWLPLFEGVRNALVVLPLVLTWFSLGLAALAYYQSLKLPAKQSSTITGQSLFQQWQEGFPLLPSVTLGPWHIPLTILNARFTFSEVAFLDVMILLSLIILTLVIHLREGYAHWVSAGIAKRMEEKLDTFSRNSNALTARAGHPEMPSWASVVVDSAGTVEHTASKLGEVYIQIKDIYKELDATLPEVAKHIKKMRDDQDYSAEQWSVMSDKLQIALDGIAEVGDQLNPDLELRQRAARARRRTPSVKRGEKKSLFARVRGWLRRSR